MRRDDVMTVISNRMPKAQRQEPTITRDDIAADVEAFLASGKRPEVLPNWVGPNRTYQTKADRDRALAGAKATKGAYKKKSSRWHGSGDKSNSLRWNNSNGGPI